MSNENIKLKKIEQNSIIQILHSKIVELVNANQTLSKEKSNLESSLRYYRTLEEKIKKIRDKNNELQKKCDDLIIQKEKELKEMKLKFENIIHNKEYELEKYKTNISIYNQKMNMVRQIEMENEIFKNEIKELKDKNEEILKTTKNKLDDYEIQNKIKYAHLKSSMIEHLKEAKNQVTKLNLNYMDINNKISVLQHQKLITSLENIQIQCDNYKEMNKKLIKKIQELESEVALHKKIEIKLALKSKERQEKQEIEFTNSLINNEKSKTFSKFNNASVNTNENKKNQSISPPPLLNNSNNENIKDLKKTTIFKNKDNLKSLKNTNYDKLVSNSLYSSDNEKENYFTKSKKEFNYAKYKQKIKEKDEKIEILEMQVDKLNHKINSYFMKYKGLFNYLEFCLNEFYHDEKVLKINSSISIETIKKFDFSTLDKKDQYSILVILMNYLMNLLTVNLGQNKNKESPFFATNLKYINTNLKFTKENFNQLFIKNPFVNRNNKILNTFTSYKTNKLNFSIASLNENNSSNDYRIFENKYKTLI